MKTARGLRWRAIAARTAASCALLLSLDAASTAQAQSPPSSRIGAPGDDATPLRLSLAQAPQGAPNVVIVLLDDVGFGAASTFGGPVPTPTLDRLAAQGLRYNRFHTAAICSPTRAALLTGRNPHAVGVGAVLNTPAPYPGYAGILSRRAATVAEILRRNGYATAAFGKWHLAPEWESTAAGPFDRWPLRQGFDRFYGFLAAETDQYQPHLISDASPVPTPRRAGYHLTEDLADRAIEWMQRQRSIAPDRPFFLYFTPGGTHAPHQVPKAWIERFRGRYAQGWDRLREETFARQRQLGVIPQNAELTARPAEIPTWESVDAAERRLSSRLMETYAAFLAHTDAQVGRLVDTLERLRVLDDTLFIYIVGDNGASGEGPMTGERFYIASRLGAPYDPAREQAGIETIGGPQSHPNYPVGWAWAMNTPFRWTKQIASHLGGTRNPLVISWPKRIPDGARGGLRSQFSFVSDIAPTVLEAAGIEPPASVDGITQQPIDGASLVHSFDEARSPTRHRTQYFQVFGNRAIVHDGWMASALGGRMPWDSNMPPRSDLVGDRWELFHLDEDFSQARDLADREPQRLRALQALFWAEAGRNDALPIVTALRNPGMPSLSEGRRAFTYFAGMQGIPETQAPAFASRSHSITANITLGAQDRGGTLIALGGVGGGWALRIDAQRRPVYVYNFFAQQLTALTGTRSVPSGRGSRVQLEVEYEGKAPGRAAVARLRIDGEPAGELRLPRTAPAYFSIHETLDVGVDTGSAVGAYAPDERFSGTIERIDIELR